MVQGQRPEQTFQMTTPEQLAKLPKWAQDELRTLRRQCDDATDNLREWTNAQTPSKIYMEDGLDHRIFIQGDAVCFEHAGIKLRVSCYHENRIALTIDAIPMAAGDVCIVPNCRNSIDLFTKQNMRD